MIYKYSNVQNLYLINLDIDKQMALNFKKFKYVNKIVIKNVKFKSESFYIFFDSLKYNIIELEIYENHIPDSEIKILRELKFLKYLKMQVPYLDEKLVFYNLFHNMIQKEFSVLELLKIRCGNLNKSDPIFDELLERSSRLYISINNVK